MIEDKVYDVVIIGAGIAGAIVAKSLSHRGKSVLILEGGKSILQLEADQEIDTRNAWLRYQDFLETFYETEIKIPNAPYPQNENSPQPLATDIPKQPLPPKEEKGYFVQKGPLPFGSTYTRTSGGTTLHWLGTCLRMLPADFKLYDNYGVGLNWPISYEDLMPYYRKGEREIGVSGNVESQKIHGLHFDSGYVFPMEEIPQSYLDMQMAQKMEQSNAAVEFSDGEVYPLRVQSTPQGRNGMPNPKYKDYHQGEEFRPVGAVGNPAVGERCDGNSNCTPICPIQAKYNALKTLNAVKKEMVDLRSQAVASRILFDKENGHILGIEYKAYADVKSPDHRVLVARGKKYVLAASAIENAKLMLASGIHSTSDQVGRNLLDHPSMVTWGLMPEKIGSYRGPGSTSGIPAFRNGKFRSQHAAFRIEIGNWGWSWPHADPYTSIGEIVDHQPNLFFTPAGSRSLINLTDGPLHGIKLREFVKNTMGRQFRLAFEFEQLAKPENRVTIDPDYKDQLGNFRPVIHYNLSDYDKAAMAAAKRVSDELFRVLGVDDFTHFDPSEPGYVEYEGQGFVYEGAGHVGGTHIMGTTKNNSVVNSRQQCWDHDNLYLVGSGNFPTLATSNPTLTIAALSFWAAEHILEELGG